MEFMAFEARVEIPKAKELRSRPELIDSRFSLLSIYSPSVYPSLSTEKLEDCWRRGMERAHS